MLLNGCVCFSTAGSSDSGLCVAQVNGKACTNHSLPFTRHCLQRILTKMHSHVKTERAFIRISTLTIHQLKDTACQIDVEQLPKMFY